MISLLKKLKITKLRNNLQIYRQLVTQIDRPFYPYHKIDRPVCICPKERPNSSRIWNKYKFIVYQLLNGIPLKDKNLLTNFLFDEIFLPHLDFKWVQNLITTKTTFPLYDNEAIEDIKFFQVVLKFTVFSLNNDSIILNDFNFSAKKDPNFNITDFEFHFKFHFPKSLSEYSSEQSFPNLIEGDFKTSLTVWLSNLIAKYHSHNFYITQINFELSYHPIHVFN